MSSEKGILENFKKSVTEMSEAELHETLTNVRTSRDAAPKKVTPTAKKTRAVKELSEETKAAMNSLDLGAL